MNHYLNSIYPQLTTLDQMFGMMVVETFLRVSGSIESMSPKTDFTMKIRYLDYCDSNGVNNFLSTVIAFACTKRKRNFMDDSIF